MGGLTPRIFRREIRSVSSPPYSGLARNDFVEKNYRIVSMRSGKLSGELVGLLGGNKGPR